MKKLLLSFVAAVTLSLTTFGQAPEGFKYQAVVRDAGNAIINNQTIGLRMTIQQGSIGGTTVYAETFSTTTNAYGLVNLEIGKGTVLTGTFATIDWANGPFFMETAADVTGGTNYTVMGTSQLMSVPYALYAKTSGSSTPGPQGPQGTTGNDGATGPQGPAGSNGTNGQSAYEIAVTNGYIGTEAQWLTSLQGATGATGPAGANGQGGVTTAGSGINITGAGTVASPYVVSTNSPCGLAIGQTYQGGIIFYLDASGCHGLISAPTDQSTTIVWWNGGFTDTYASGSGLFDGDGNCYGIRRSQGDCASCNAAELCLDLSLGGYSDWYLPSKYELNLMYLNIGQGNALGLGNVGGFAGNVYWSSTESDNFYVWLHYFHDGFQYIDSKSASGFVRAVRAF
jgi:hypothetical protein